MANAESRLVTDDITRQSIGIVQMIIFQIDLFLNFCSWSYDKTDKAHILWQYSDMMAPFEMSTFRLHSLFDISTLCHHICTLDEVTN